MENLKKTTLSIIIPLYNEENSIAVILDKIYNVVLPYNIDKQIVIINDCSRDNSAKVVNNYIEMNPDRDITFCSHDKNMGKGKALRTGFEYIKGDYTIIQDADLEYDPNDYIQLLKWVIENKQKVVYGSRFLNKENKHSYKTFYIGGRIVSIITNVLYKQNLTDEPTCYKMFETDLLKSVYLECEGFEFCPEITAKISLLGYKIKELPINYFPRSIEEGKKIKWTDGLEAISTLFKYRFFSHKILK